MMDLRKRYEDFMDRVRKRAESSKRSPSEITVVAVSKTFPIEAIAELFSLGHRDFGENYVQEAKKKIEKINSSEIRWHMVGSLQKNKVKYMPSLFQWFHALDSVELLNLLSERFEKAGKKLNLLIQVDFTGKEGRSGVKEEDVFELAKACLDKKGISLKGLMTLPPPPSKPEDSRPFFRRLRELKEKCIKSGIPPECMKELSMGMSDDFEVAIEEGATILRIGRAIFGERNG
jgi:pyridoxal phosphate enzyme (YggS family)